MRDADPLIGELLQAADRGDTAVVLDLLASGVDVNAHSEGESTALLMAVRNGHIETIRVLLEHGAHPNPDDSRGYTALTHAILRSLPRRWHPAWVPDPEPLKLLKAAGARYNLIDAVLSNDLELVRSRLDEGGDPNEGEGSYSGPLLMEAAECGHVEMVDLLLDRGARIEATDDICRTSLHCAAQKGQTEVVIRLLDLGADLDAVNSTSALGHAAIGGHHDLVSVLMSRGAKRGIVDALALNDQTILVSLLDEKLREGSDIDWITDGRYRIALLAAGLGNAAIVRLLLDRGAAHLRKFDDHSLLAEASKHGHVEVVRLLIDRGADLHAVGEDGLTPLDWAIREGRDETAALLRLAEVSRPPRR